MKSQQGFTFIELIVFIVITSLLASTILLAFNTSLLKTPSVQQNLIALQTARKCMEWITGQKRMNGLASIPCPSSTTPAFCSAPSGFAVAVTFTCTTLNSDPNYETVTVTVSGKGDARLSALFADY